MRTSAIITAAGRSSRMGASKMRLPFGSGTVLSEAVTSLLRGGVEDVVVVLGRDAEDIKADLASLPVRFVTNSHYAHTDMLTSVQLGQAALQPTDPIFVMPGDMPLVAPAVIAAMASAWHSQMQALTPTFKGTRGHPLLLSSGLAAEIPYETTSLRHLLLRAKVTELPVWDRGVVMDLDTPGAYHEGLDLYEKKKHLDKSLCEDLWDYMKLPLHIRAHNEAVAKVAISLSKALNRKGHDIDVSLVAAASRLHDLFRMEKKHDAAAADFLNRIGHPGVADVIATHMRVTDEIASALSAEAIVFYADKITEETCRVTPHHRYASAMRRFPADTEIGAGIRQNLAHAMAIEKRLKDELGNVFPRALKCRE